jgi:hypothetical protein
MQSETCRQELYACPLVDPQDFTSAPAGIWCSHVSARSSTCDACCREPTHVWALNASKALYQGCPVGSWTVLLGLGGWGLEGLELEVAGDTQQ